MRVTPMTTDANTSGMMGRKSRFMNRLPAGLLTLSTVHRTHSAGSGSGGTAVGPTTADRAARSTGGSGSAGVVA